MDRSLCISDDDNSNISEKVCGNNGRWLGRQTAEQNI